MGELVLAVLAIGIGAAFCLRGYVLLRLLLALWAGLIGFVLGAGLVAGVTGDGLGGDVVPWLAGLVLAVVFAAAAYAFYAVSVVLAMVSGGFVIGVSAMVALDIDWTWAVVAAGVVGGLALGVLAVAGRAPMVLLVLASASGGASAVVAGVMLLAGTLEAADLDRTAVVERIDASPAWGLGWLVVAAVGVVVQLRAVGPARPAARQQWHRDRPVVR
jgi:hypothetical protein